MDLTPSGILAGLLVSSIGFALYRYGRTCVRGPQLVAGLALMIFPVFVAGAAWVLALAAALLLALWLGLRAGL